MPLSMTIVIGVILIFTHNGSDYKSEWFIDDGFGLTIGLTILLSLLISLLSLTVLLNRLPTVKRNPLLSFICWTLLPGIVCFIVIYEETLNFTGHSDIDGSYEGNRLIDGYIMSVAALHFVSLLIGYIHYQVRLKNQNPANSG